MEPKYAIWVKTKGGETFLAFHWCLDAESGCSRARREAPKFGHDVVQVWAVAL